MVSERLQQVARALETVHARRLEEHSAELAEHFAHSSDPGDLSKAVAYGEMAASRALAVYAYGEAVRHLEQALEVQTVLDPDNKVRRCDLLLALGEALMPAGEPRRAVEEIAEEAFSLAEALGDPTRAGGASRIAVLGLHRYGGNAAVTWAAWQQWAARADRHAQGGTADRVFAEIALARASLAGARPAEFREHSRRALDLARQLGDPEALFASVGQFSRCRPRPGTPLNAYSWQRSSAGGPMKG